MPKVWHTTGRAVLSVIIGLVTLACGAAATPTPEPPPRDPIVFSDLSWDSAKLQNRIAMFIVERGYGYPVDIISGDTIALFDELLKGSTQVTMEIWLPNQQEDWDHAVGDGSIIPVGRSLDDTWQSTFVVPRYVLDENPGLTSVHDLRKFKDFFVTPDSNGKARLVTCVVGWECEKINAQKIAAYGLTDVVELVSPQTDAALFASLEGAYIKRDPWLGYMWGPTRAESVLDLAPLTEPECGVGLGPETGCAYPKTRVLIAVHPSLINRAPEVVEFLRVWHLPGPAQIATVDWMAEQDATVDETAIWFLRNQDIWTDWVPPDIERRVKDALAEEAA